MASAKRSARAGTVVCTGTTRVKKAGKVRLVCALNATGRKLRKKGALKVVLTMRFVPKKGAIAVSTRTVTIPRATPTRPIVGPGQQPSAVTG